MSTPAEFAVLAMAVLVGHVAISTELLLKPWQGMPARWALLVRTRGNPSKLARAITAAFLVGLQLPMVWALLNPAKVGGSLGVAVAGLELVAAGMWLAILVRKRAEVSR